MAHVLSKTEFAKLKQRSPACVTKWLKLGKISPAALIEVDGIQKIIVEQAERDLSRSLDPAQQFAQENPAIGMTLPTASSEASVPAAPSPRRAADDDDLARKRKADADRSEEEAIAARRRNAAEEGRWVEADAAQKEFNKEMAALFAGFESFLFNDVARDVGNRHSCDWKAEATHLRQIFRAYRSKVAIDATERCRQIEQQTEPDSTEGIDQAETAGDSLDEGDSAAAAAAGLQSMG